MRRDTLGLDHFERLYRGNLDPWRFASSPYERDKYAATLAALPRPRYARGLDVGCSIGVFTAALADRCDALLGVEPVEAALAQARARLAARAHVRFAPLFVPRQWPQGTFDLVVVSEVLDYLGEDDLAGLADRLRGALEPGGDLVLVHWVGKKRGRGTDEASDALIGRMAPHASVTRADRNADYRLDVLRRATR